ncbi:MAG: diaminopimelate decarboxylase [Armatimonadetes bacterium 13_1_40CM_3_65_7]|nr:MAG: diaminopimelate decarboxylase [Armatimonadetes bacterium 13_1_40CM_3_65_7]
MDQAASLLLGEERDGEWVVGGVGARRLAREHGTPVYVLDEARLRANCRAYVTALHDIYPNSQAIFASKALCCMATCRLAYDEGMWVDVVSAGEIHTALRAGVPAGALMLHGNNKTRDELALAIDAGVGRIGVDNFNDLELLDALTREAGRRVDVLLRLTPGIEPHTHKAISTGGVDSKFGFGIPDGTAQAGVRRTLELPGVRLRGLHCHIGSQVMDLAPFEQAAHSMMEIAAWMARDCGVAVEELDLGGGLGIRYLPADRPPAIRDYVATLAAIVRERAGAARIPLPRLMVEPGRSIVGEAGATLYRVGAIKPIAGIRTYVSVDGGMYENPRPALYQARYEAALAERLREPRGSPVTIAGRCCESGDVLIWETTLPEPRPGDLLVVFSTGAYTYSMAGNYNRYPRPPVVFVQDGRARVVVVRETVDDLLSKDVPPA